MPWSRRARWTLVTGVMVMAAASLWAPQQPELIDTGACQLAPCGMLEDPLRWQAAWWLWAVGFAAMVISVTLLVPPMGGMRPKRVLLLLGLAPILAVTAGILAVVVSLFTSVHGAATVAACGVLGPVLAVVTGLAKEAARRSAARRDLTSSSG